MKLLIPLSVLGSLFMFHSSLIGNPNKIVGIGYSVWFDHVDYIGSNPEYPFHHELDSNGQIVEPPYYTGYHWWGVSAYAKDPDNTRPVDPRNDLQYDLRMYNFYDRANPDWSNKDSINTHLIDYHADYLSDAGVDFIGIDLSNGNQSDIWDSAKAVAHRYSQLLSDGVLTPKIVFYIDDASSSINKFVNEVWNEPSIN